MSKEYHGLFDGQDDLDDIDVPDAPAGTPVPDAVEEREAEKTAGDGDSDAGAGDSSGEAPTGRVSRDIYDVIGRARPQKIAPAAPAAEPTPAAPAVDDADSAPTEVFAADATGGQGGEVDDEYRLPTDDETATTAFAGTPAAYTDPGPVYESPFDGDGGARYAAADTSGAPDAAGATGAADGDNETRVFAPAGAPAAAAAAAAPAGDGYGDADGYDGYAETYGTAGVPVPEQEAEDADRVAAGDAVTVRRGTLDLGLLILRLITGVLLGLRGVQTLFAFGGDPGIDTLEQVLGGYDGASVLALALPIAELVGGALLVLGLLTPLAGAVTVVSAGFMALHYLAASGAGYWPYQLDANAQAWGFLAVLGLVLIFTGPGRYAVDGSRGWATRPRASAWLWAVIGLAGGAALWILVGGGNPF